MAPNSAGRSRAAPDEPASTSPRRRSRVRTGLAILVAVGAAGWGLVAWARHVASSAWATVHRLEGVALNRRFPGSAGDGETAVLAWEQEALREFADARAELDGVLVGVFAPSMRDEERLRQVWVRIRLARIPTGVQDAEAFECALGGAAELARDPAMAAHRREILEALSDSLRHPHLGLLAWLPASGSEQPVGALPPGYMWAPREWYEFEATAAERCTRSLLALRATLPDAAAAVTTTAAQIRLIVLGNCVSHCMHSFGGGDRAALLAGMRAWFDRWKADLAPPARAGGEASLQLSAHAIRLSAGANAAEFPAMVDDAARACYLSGADARLPDWAAGLVDGVVDSLLAMDAGAADPASRAAVAERIEILADHLGHSGGQLRPLGDRMAARAKSLTQPKRR